MGGKNWPAQGVYSLPNYKLSQMYNLWPFLHSSYLIFNFDPKLVYVGDWLVVSIQMMLRDCECHKTGICSPPPPQGAWGWGANVEEEERFTGLWEAKDRCLQGSVVGYGGVPGMLESISFMSVLAEHANLLSALLLKIFQEFLHGSTLLCCL